MTNLEKYFLKFKENIVGNGTVIETPYGSKSLLYADWIASGRMYQPIEDNIQKNILPLVANTHSESSYVGMYMTNAYHMAKEVIRKHVNANSEDVLITSDAGMTRAVNKFIRILGFKLPDQRSFFYDTTARKIPDMGDLGDDRPVVFITHFEHHSHQITWVESIAEVVIIPPTEDLQFSLKNLQQTVEKFKNRRIKIGAFSAGSNVTGIIPPISEMAKIMHKYDGYCFVDYAAAAPYVKIDMHPADSEAYLDAIYFSPHKFLGGPGSAAVLVFNKKFYHNISPDHPGGGTVRWTNPWNGIGYFHDIEMREDGGTPAFLQTIRAALSIKLKDEMGIENIAAREKEILDFAFEKFGKLDGLNLLAPNIHERLGVISFYCNNVHHNFIVRLLNDLYGIQVRGGCSCAGTYGHYLFHIDQNSSKNFTDLIDKGDLSEKPGWARVSLHPTMTNDELEFVVFAVKDIIENAKTLEKDYFQDNSIGEWIHKTYKDSKEKLHLLFD